MMTLTAVGDLMLGDSAITVGFGFRSRYPGGQLQEALQDLKPVLQVAEVAIGNLECSLTESGRGRTRLARDQMRGDPAYAQVLRDCGFRALGLANNHAVQHGRDAFFETLTHLEAAGIACFGLRGSDGWCSKPVVLPLTGGRTLGILGYCWRPRQYGREEPPFAEGSREEVLADVERLGERVDHLVLSLHWGEEFVLTPSETEVAFARAAVSAGADVVVGHHPHVARPVERFAGGVIAYSLGNAISDMLWQDAFRAGLALQCSFEPAGLEALISPLLTDKKYCPRLAGPSRPVEGHSVQGLPDDEYHDQVEKTVRSQRWASYRYAARHLGRYPLRVSLELAAATVVNRIGSLLPRRHG